MSAFERQIGGSHYVGMRLQPIEFATANRYDPALFSVLKYLSRYKSKGGVVDLEKGIHFVQLREDLKARRLIIPLIEVRRAFSKAYLAYATTITMPEYIRINEITDTPLADALLTLEEYGENAASADDLIEKIRVLREEHYGSAQ